jgi:hypothetical protein
MNRLLRTSLSSDENGHILLVLSWEDDENKSKWSVGLILDEDQLQGLETRVKNLRATYNLEERTS